MKNIIVSALVAFGLMFSAYSDVDETPVDKGCVSVNVIPYVMSGMIVIGFVYFRGKMKKLNDSDVWYD